MPTQPSIILSALSDSSFQAVIAGDTLPTHRLFYRRVDELTFTTGPTLVGSGTLTVTGLMTNGQYLVWVVADLAGIYSLPAVDLVSLALLDTLTGAVHAQWQASAGLTTSVPGGLWTGEVPEGTTLAYASLDLSGVRSNPLFESQFEMGRFTIHLYAIGAGRAEVGALQVKAAFDYKTLTFTSAVCVQCVPATYRLVSEAVRHKTGELIHRAILAYDILLQRDRYTGP